MSTELESLRRDAKRLKRAFAAGEPDAVRRLRAAVPEPNPPLHADFLHTIALEAGHESWPKLKLALETKAMTRDQRAHRLRIALYFGQGWVIDKLIADDASLRHHDFGIELALFDLQAAEARLASDAGAATAEVAGRPPIAHLCFSQFARCAEIEPDRILAIAELLRRNGARVNETVAAPPPESEHRLSVLYGALGHAGNLPLAAWLLENGADPNDNESLYHATELDSTDGLKLLIRHNVKTEGTNALLRALDFDRIEAVELLLAHGADPNEGPAGHPSGQPMSIDPALHHAAKRGRSGAFADLLVRNGADPKALFDGRSAYCVARMLGNRDFAAWMERNGHATPLDPVAETLAAGAEGRAPRIRFDTAELGREERRFAVHVAGRPGGLAHLRRLIEAGLDPDEPDAMQLPALHIAAWSGMADQVAYLLTLGPDLERENGYGGDAIGTVIHGAEFAPAEDGADHIACARLLLEAGSRFPYEDIRQSGVEELVGFFEDWRDAHGLPAESGA